MTYGLHLLKVYSGHEHHHLEVFLSIFSIQSFNPFLHSFNGQTTLLLEENESDSRFD